LSTVQIGYTRVAKIVRIAAPANAELYIPDATVEEIPYFDIRQFSRVVIEIDADQPISVDIQNTPSGDPADFRDLAGYSLPSASFLTDKRNVITIDGADAAIGFIRLKITTGTTAPSNIVVWVECKG